MKKINPLFLLCCVILTTSIAATQNLDRELDTQNDTRLITLYNTDYGSACITAANLNLHGGTNISTNGSADTIVISFFNNQSTYTPVLAFGGSSTGITYSTQSGYYCVIGTLVIYTASLVLTSKGSATGAATVSLPAYTSIGSFPTNVQLQNVTFTGLIFGTVPSSSQLVDLQQCASGAAATNLTDTNFANNSIITISGFYLQ